jgi:hypothetical protein
LFAVRTFPVIVIRTGQTELRLATWALINQGSNFSLTDRTFLENFPFFHHFQLLLYSRFGGILWFIPLKTVNVKSFSPIAGYEPQANGS